MTIKIKGILGLSLMIFLFFGCGPKSVTTEKEALSLDSQSWIPFNGNNSVSFKLDTNTMVFTSGDRESWYENVRYMTDQSGFFTVQKDFYADLERQEITFTSNQTNYFLKYSLEKNKGETGDWDIFRLEMAEGNYYKNDLKIVTYQTDTYDKGEYFSFKKNLTLAGQSFSDVYYLKQERRPFELYYTQAQGVIGFKVSTNELWVIQLDTLK